MIELKYPRRTIPIRTSSQRVARSVVAKHFYQLSYFIEMR